MVDLTAMGHVAVVGAGVSGLTSAIRLAEDGHVVRVLARDQSPNTTSDVAAAIWGPYKCEPVEQVTQWAVESFSTFVQIASDPDSGVVMRHGIYGFASGAAPQWTNDVPDLEMLDAGSVPDWCGSAARARLPIIEMNRYLPWLHQRLDDLNVQHEERLLTSLDDVDANADVIVNASGLGARTLVDDHTLYPVRGRVVYVEQVGIEEFVDLETDGWPIGIFPRRDDIVLTGTYEENEYQLDVDREFDDRIVERCVAIVPRLASARRLRARSGLRPARPAIRLEADRSSSGVPIVHNYGHGGGGVTLSWSCADEVVRHVATLLQ